MVEKLEILFTIMLATVVLFMIWFCVTIYLETNQCATVCYVRQMKYDYNVEVTGSILDRHLTHCGCYYFRDNYRVVRWFEVGD